MLSPVQVQSNVADHIAAGGHQGYASLGALYSQARPMLPNLYGDINAQTEGAPVRLRILIDLVYTLQ